MKRTIKLTESDLERIVRRVIKENEEEYDIHSNPLNSVDDDLKNYVTFEKDSYGKGDLGGGFTEEQMKMFGDIIMDFIRQADNIEDPYVKEIVSRSLINSHSLVKQKFRRHPKRK